MMPASSIARRLLVATLFLFAADAWAAAAGPTAKPAAADEAADEAGNDKNPLDDWVEPTHREPAPTRFQTFHSPTLQADASYLIYLPPSYETSGKRYPVVYWLHGRVGPQWKSAGFAERLDAAIRAGTAPEAIAVLVNGRQDSMYVDWPDGSMPIESVVIKDLVPHIDATYRTIARREGRAVEGFSMGGAGTLRFGFKYPELFGVMSSMSTTASSVAAMYELMPDRFTRPFVDGPAMREASDPFELVKKNVDAIRGRTKIRLVVGNKDKTERIEGMKKLHAFLEEQGIENTLVLVPGVAHSYENLYDKMGEQAFGFWRQAFAGVE